MSDEKAQKLREKIQTDVVSLITQKLKEGQMTQERAQRIAAMVLERMPEDITYQELLKIIPKLDDEFTELADVVVPVMVEYEKKLHSLLEERVLKLVRAKKFKEAVEEARKGMEIERRLS